MIPQIETDRLLLVPPVRKVFEALARPEMAGKNIVVVLSCFAERYLSTPLFDSV